ncbi:MAG: hypothetical protein PHH54_01725 [Candidatus Nanoarchaeia archaeon]|nr:hypothetical protein [Candidatus Nanoarchaeia archaeon]MDD5740681.1 hypothetical protein [Candidatus Nanoarchaeia archaeon]
MGFKKNLTNIVLAGAFAGALTFGLAEKVKADYGLKSPHTVDANNPRYVAPVDSCAISLNALISDSNNAVEDINGPTVLLGYSKRGSKENPISSFMYFVPLISPTFVDRETSSNNEQKANIISYEKKVTSKSFNLVCEFEIRGKGFHKNIFEPEGMIARNTDDLKEGEPLENTLNYIKFEGEGFGRIEVQGTVTNSANTVTEVDLKFNARGQKSPVTVGLYSVKPKNGQYKYENRYNELVARVNTLSFKKTKDTPRMGIKVASISDTEESEGFLSGFKGFIANLFIKPPKVTELGNETMLNFGHELLEKKPTFTFPKAKNLRKNKKI